MYNSSQFSNKTVYDSSYFDGLTGLAFFFLEVNNLVEGQSLYSSSILNNIQGFTFTNTKSWIPLYDY